MVRGFFALDVTWYESLGGGLLMTIGVWRHGRIFGCCVWVGADSVAVREVLGATVACLRAVLLLVLFRFMSRICLLMDRLRAKFGQPLCTVIGAKADGVFSTQKRPAALRKHRLEVREKLCRLPGVGLKVADCIALFALKQHGAVPVDVHVWRIVTRDYDPELRK
eukprot:symbB.v1.2.040865.t1/scaffold7605.1/size10310/1